MLLDIVILILSLIMSVYVTFYRRWFYKKLKPIITFLKKKKTLFDSNGIPYVDYGYKEKINIGIQRSPIAVAVHAFKLYNKYNSTKNKKIKKMFMNNANWLLHNTLKKKGFSTLEYSFPWPTYNLQPPWRSAMANGQALQALCLAHKLSNDMKYLDTAKNLLHSFFVEVHEGGVTYKDSFDSWWYEEYVGDNYNVKESRVLNGMLFTLIGIYDYYKYTQDIKAKILFNKGIKNVTKNLAKYDNNGNSYYDILNNPANNYHKIHIDLLNQLFNITNEGVFKKYSDRWNNYYVMVQCKKKNKKNIIGLSFYKRKKNILYIIITFSNIFIIFKLLLYLLK